MNLTSPNYSCPLCLSSGSKFYHSDRLRDFFNCTNCQLVFVLPGQYLSLDQEKAQYDLHQNSPEDPEYRKFLSRLFNPLNKILKLGSYGLDFGSGPGPTLSVMFEEAGHYMNIYDPIYANEKQVFTRKYDFITATEVFEHLIQPKQELDRLFACLRIKGYLGVMTKLVKDRKAFAKWHYKNDLTHVCFFSRFTFEWLALQWQAEIKFMGSDTIIIEKMDG